MRLIPRANFCCFGQNRHANFLQAAPGKIAQIVSGQLDNPTAWVYCIGMNRERHNQSGGQGQGMNWCRPATRLAVYLRDGLACVYCGATVETGAKLTLDHLTPVSRGGQNAPTNLVTCCHRCNSSRGNRSVSKFAGAAAAYLNHGATAAEIVAHVRRTVRRVLPRAEARELISRRGSVALAIRG